MATELPQRLRTAVAVQRALSPILFWPPIAALAGKKRRVIRGGRRLDRETAAMLAFTDLDQRNDLTRYAPPEARLVMAAQVASVSAPAPAGVATENLFAEGPAGPIPLRRYVPSGLAAPSPGVVFFHGGGWVLGDLDTHDAFCRALAVAAGCRVVAVDYRLAPEHRFPAAVDDAVAAFRWIAGHAADLGIDPSRIAVLGDSAGGNLAAVVSRRTRGEAHTPALQVLVYPGLDATRSLPSHREVGEGYILTERLIEWFLEHYLGDADRRHPDISVLLTDDVRGVAPALVYTAGFDPLRDEGRAYAERLESEGVRARHTEFPSLIHGFALMTGAIPAAQRATAEIFADVRRALRPG